ncbi:MAG: type II toxin-antitoxin system PemK/MazF family toxin [Candidatus Woesearchaeota archaeon]
MEKLVKGDIVVIRFPFSDLSASKKRPAFVAASLQNDEFILCQITSQARIDNYSVPISTDDFAQGSLHLTSIIKPNKLFTADKSLIERKIGYLKQEKTDEVIDEICRIFKK